MELLSGKKFNSVSWKKPDEGVKPFISRIKRETGDLELNPDLWPKFPAYFRRFFELHEFAHWNLNTRSEELANAYAISHFVRLGTAAEDVKHLEEIKVFINENNLNADSFNSNDLGYSDIPVPIITGIIAGGSSLLTSIFGSSSAKKQRDLVKAQNELAAETELQRLKYQQDYLKLQAAIQDDEQDATQKQTILIGIGLAGFVVLIAIILIVKALLK